MNDVHEILKVIPYTKTSPEAKEPSQANFSDAGYDLFSTEELNLKPFERSVVKTGIKLALPEGYYGRVAPRSGLAIKKGIDVLAGVIDSGYRGEIGVVLINLSSSDQTLNKGDKIAQLIIEKCYEVCFSEVSSLSDSDRGEGGFGSSGE